MRLNIFRCDICGLEINEVEDGTRNGVRLYYPEKLVKGSLLTPKLRGFGIKEVCANCKIELDKILEDVYDYHEKKVIDYIKIVNKKGLAKIVAKKLKGDYNKKQHDDIDIYDSDFEDLPF